MKSDWWWCFQELEAKFGDKVEVTGEGTPDTTGYLEVIMVVIMVVTVVMVVIVMMGDGDNCTRSPRNDGLPEGDSTFASVL